MRIAPAILIASFLSASVCAPAHAAKDCEELKSEIAQKLEAKGVKAYTLDIVGKDAEVKGDSKVAGTCGGGTKKIVYTRGAAPAEKTLAGSSKP
jgi:Protein of unknown function (DUF1161)